MVLILRTCWALLPRRLEYILRNAAAARALRERMSQVRTLVEALPDVLWVASPSGDIRWSSNSLPRPGHVDWTVDRACLCSLSFPADWVC